MKQATLVLLASVNGRDSWFLVKPEEVPAWVRKSENMAHLVNGEACYNRDEGEAGLWYRAATEADVPGIKRILAAKEKRKRKNAKRVLH